MTTLAMKTHIADYLAAANDAQIEKLYALLQEDNSTANASELSNDQLAILDVERRRYLNGEGNSYSWEQVKEMIRKRKAS